MEISSGELLRRLDVIDKKLEEMPSAIASEFVRRELFETQHKHLEGRVEKLEDRSEWIARLVIGIIVAGLLAGAISYG